MPQPTNVLSLAPNCILWAEDSVTGESSDQYSDLVRQIHPLRVLQSRGLKASLEMAGQPEVALIIGVEGMDPQFAIQFLSEVRKVRPEVPRLLVSRTEDVNQLKEMVNRAGVFGILSAQSGVEISAQIYEALRIKERLEDRTTLIRKVKVQNQSLEELTSGQSELVRERTAELQASKSELEVKVTEFGRLIRFVKDLAGLVAVEELVDLLREETKAFHQVGEPILACVLPNQSRQIFQMRSGKLVVTPARNPWPRGLRLRVNEKEDSQYLADAFSRPVGRVLAIPLPSGKRAQSDEKYEVPALFFEHSLNEPGQDLFIHFLSARLQPLSLVLDRILLEHELRNTVQLWEQSFDGFEEPIAIVDVEYNLIGANQSFTAQVDGHKCYQQFQDAAQVCVGCPVSTALDSAGPSLALVRRGTQVFEVHSYPIRLNEEGRPTTVVNHYLDVTRAHELQSRMVQNEKMAAIGHLAGHIAHELNNPLTGIRSTAQILLYDRTPGNALYSDLLEVEKAAARCQSIIRNLLEFSRGGGEIVLKVVPLNEIVNKTLPFLKTAMNPFIREIELTEEDTRVRVEPQLLQQVVFNIVNNACQAMEDQGTLWISTETGVEDGQGYVDFRVRDSGKGIPEHIGDAIFDPFFTTKAVGKGTGLGLSMSRKVVEEFGGKIWYWSDSKNGTEFTVRLPQAGDLS
ncbi:MAG: PAS domain-containing sensor histidine kinase [Bdellovibrionales bacterium]|nr:PAS domain-containing sensor histidine kinase [Bdellovibrionales bacterium]